MPFLPPNQQRQSTDAFTCILSIVYLSDVVVLLLLQDNNIQRAARAADVVHCILHRRELCSPAA